MNEVHPETYTFPVYGVKNPEVKVKILSDETMKAAGFADDIIEGSWVAAFSVHPPRNDVAMEVIVPKANPNAYTIQIIDRGNGNEYPYEYFLELYPKYPLALAVSNAVNGRMELLTKLGVVEGYRVK